MNSSNVTRARAVALGWGAIAAFLLLGALWHQSGVLDYVDANFPATIDATLTSIRRYSASWDWYANMGRPNPSFLSEQVLLAPYLAAQFVFGTGLASKVLVFGMVLSTYGGTLGALRRLGVGWFGAVAGATFAIVNPWYFDEIAQGHIYLLMSAWAVPLAFVLFVQARRWSSADSLLGFFAIFYIVAIDFRFAALLYFVAAVGIVVRLHAVPFGETLWRSAALIAPPVLLAFIVFAYAAMVGALRAGNAPSSSSLDYYSNFTSLWSALTLVRPNYNALDQVGRLGDRLSFYWAFAYGALLLAAAGAFRLRVDRALKTLLAVVGATGIVLGSGLNSPFGPLNALLHDRVPLYGDLFRDPSKFFVLQTFAYAIVIGLVANVVPRWPFGRLQDVLEAPLSRVVRCVLVPAGAALAALLYVAPFLGWDFSTAAAFDAGQNKAVVEAVDRAEREANDAGARFAMFPPGVRVAYAGNPAFVYDPLALFPTAPNVRIPVAYDFDQSSLAARWGLANVDSARTPVPGSLLEDLGIGRIAVRDVRAQYDLGIESGTLRSVAASDLVHQRGLSAGGAGVFRTAGGIATGSDGAVVVDGDRETIVTARSLGILPSGGAWCFVAQCRPTQETFALSDLTQAPAGEDLDVTRFGTADYGAHWIVGTIAWAEMNLNASRSATPSIVGFGKVTGSAAFPTRAGDADVWVRAIDVDDRAAYRLTGFDRSLRLEVPRALALDGFKWYRLGRVHLRSGTTSLQLTGSGPRLCISNIRLTQPDAPLPRRDAYVGSLVDATSWTAGNVYQRPSDWSIDGFRVLFGGRRAARLDFRTAIPDGTWRVALHGRADTRTGIVQVRSASTCQLSMNAADSIQQCDVRIRNGAFSISSTRGNIYADGIGVYDATAVHAERLAGHTLRFTHDNGSFTVDNPKQYRYVAVRVADPTLWDSRASRFGTAFGYGMLFDGSASKRIDAVFAADKRFALGLAIAAVALASIIAGIVLRRRSRTGVAPR
ncbi:MAG: hypothetical protein NVS3B16_07010 [Vulcanimicrobiaceae bacterium]